MVAARGHVGHAQNKIVGGEEDGVRVMKVNFHRWLEISVPFLQFRYPFACCYLQYVPASKLFDHAWYEVVEAITLYCIRSDNR